MPELGGFPIAIAPARAPPLTLSRVSNPSVPQDRGSWCTQLSLPHSVAGQVHLGEDSADGCRAQCDGQPDTDRESMMADSISAPEQHNVANIDGLLETSSLNPLAGAGSGVWQRPRAKVGGGQGGTDAGELRRS